MFPYYPKKPISIFRGIKIKKENIRYKISPGKDKNHFFGVDGKYDFPNPRKWKTTKKNYRTVIRRRLRRMGLLVKVPGRVKYNKARDLSM